jgi:amino acid transporter
MAKGIGVLGALSIGIGGIVGGGFFATFGIAVVGARGATDLSFLVGGLVALFTAYSYVRLTLRYPGTGGTVSFIRTSFGDGRLPSAVNVLLILSYVAIMAIYARALAAYSVSYLPPDQRGLASHLVASGALVALGLVNLAGAALMARFESVFNVGKLGVLAIFILGELVLGHPVWERLGTSEWVPWTTIISSGMVVFLAYEGFELISNASDRIVDPKRTLPIAFYGSVGAAIVIYVLAVVVAVGHMPFVEMEAARDFALRHRGEVPGELRLRADDLRGGVRLGFGDQRRLFRCRAAPGHARRPRGAAQGLHPNGVGTRGSQPGGDRRAGAAGSEPG